jgi:hypothetical protein
MTLRVGNGPAVGRTAGGSNTSTTSRINSACTRRAIDSRAFSHHLAEPRPSLHRRPGSGLSSAVTAPMHRMTRRQCCRGLLAFGAAPRRLPWPTPCRPSACHRARHRTTPGAVPTCGHLLAGPVGAGRGPRSPEQSIEQYQCVPATTSDPVQAWPRGESRPATRRTIWLAGRRAFCPRSQNGSASARRRGSSLAVLRYPEPEC